MPDEPQAASDRPPLKRIREQVHRLADQPSGLVDLGHALAGPFSPADGQACDACQAALPEYIEAELNGEPVRRRFPSVARHLELCPSCGEAYVDLLELALASEEALPVPAPMPALDLGFLPALTPSERIRELVERLATEVVRRRDAALLPDLPAAGRAFFRKIRELGEGLQLRPRQVSVLGFGPDLPPALQAVLACYTATRQVLQAFSVEELEAELGRDRPSDELQKRVRSAFRNTGMGRKEADQWAREYLDQARAHTYEFLALARQVPEDD